jgi:hypothetical protein
MWIQRTAGTALLVLMTGLPAMAQPIEIATLGRAPVWHTPAHSLAQAQDYFRNNESTMHGAARAIGLTEAQYVSFKEQLAVAQPRQWVTLPRHLDATTWGAPAHRLNDVIIPAGEKGVEIDLPDGDSTLVVYLPAKCGNLSFVRRRLAALPNPHPLVAAAQSFPYPAPQEIPPPALVSAVIPVVSCVGPPGICSPLVPPGVAGLCRGPFCFLPAVLPFLVRGTSSTTPGTPFIPSASIVGPPAPSCP